MLRRFFTTSESVFRRVGRNSSRRQGTEEGINLMKYEKMRVTNPGVDRRLAALRDDNVTLDKFDQIEDSEADFMKLEKSYDEYKTDQSAHKEFVKLKVVGKKYFDEPAPNFLTWSEKELIRELHRKDPQQWTPERISKSFPTSPQGAKKLLGVVWKPAKESRMDRHDATAIRNWRELMEGEMKGVTPELRQHLLKFSNRSIPPRDRHESLKGKIDITVSENTPGEYASIITKYQNVAERTEADRSSDKDSPEQVMPLLSEKRKSLECRGHTTLELLRQNLINSGKISPSDSVVLSSPSCEVAKDIPTGLALKSDDLQDDKKVKHMSPASSSPVTLQKDGEPQELYPLRIRIPKKSLRVGATYKVRDCYYDWDGRFLYRVPGMT